MIGKGNTNLDLGRENAELRRRLAEAEDTLSAIRHGEVDALVVNTRQGDQVFTLKSAERPYRIMVEQMTEGALTLSLEGAILFCNQRFAQMVKYPLEKLMAASIYNYIAPESRAQFTKLVDQSGQGDISLLAENRSLVPTRIALSTLNLDEDTTVHCAVVTDLTEHKQAEEELTKYREHLEELVKQRTSDMENVNKELESFSYSISHDLRAPLRTLDGFSEAVLLDYGDKLDETGQDYLNRIRKASQTMSQLIDDILKLSRITRAEMSNNKVQLNDLVRSVADEIKARQPDRHIEFIIQPDVTARGDLRLLEAALRNLLENSWKFTSKCSQARIEFGKIQQDHKPVYFIKDNGVGFDMKYVDKLFHPFQRLHSGKEYEGTGIGLATVQRIIRRHGGRIWAEAEKGKGATFYFTLG